MLRTSFLIAIGVLAGCTYGPPEDHVNVQNLALKPDGSRVAVIVKVERHRPATGISAFPDGGVPRVLVQRADLYVVDLPTRAVVYRGELPAPADHRVSFAPWLTGWDGDAVRFKVTGCPGAPGDECHGRLVRQTGYLLSPAGRITRADAPGKPVLVVSRGQGSDYLGLGAEPYGVSIGTRAGAPRSPLMRFDGTLLEVVPPPAQGPA